MKKTSLILFFMMFSLLFGCEIGLVDHHKHRPHHNHHNAASVTVTPLACNYDAYYYTLPYYDEPLVCYNDIDGYEYCEWVFSGYFPYSECLEVWTYDDLACSWGLLEEYCYPI